MNKLLIKFFKSRLLTFAAIILIWHLSLWGLRAIELLTSPDQNLMLIAHLAVVFFGLTVSPTTWIIKGPFGFEVGSNTPQHLHVTFNENSHKGRIDIREYKEDRDYKEIEKLTNSLKEK